MEAQVQPRTERPPGHPPCDSTQRDSTRRHRVFAALLVFGFIGALAVLAALVPPGHGFEPKGGGWFSPAVVGGAFTLHPLFIAVPWAACFVLGLFDWQRPWRVEHLDLLALAGFFPVAMLLSDDASRAGLWLAAACLTWLFGRMTGSAFGLWRMPELCPSISSRRLGLAIAVLLLVRVASLAGSNVSDVGQASSLGAWRLLHGLHLYGAVSWPGPGGLRVYRPDSYGPFAYYAYLPFVALLRPAPALIATLLPALCFDALTIAGLHKLGTRLGGRPLARVRVRLPALPVSRPVPAGGNQRCADRRPGCLDHRHRGGASRRPRPAHGRRHPDQIPPLPARRAIPRRQTGPPPLRAHPRRLARRDARLALITSGPTRFFNSTFGYQLIQRGGGLQFSVWTYIPNVAVVARPIFAVALVLLALAPMVRPPGPNSRQHAALAAALLIGAQLLLGYWFYSYLTWCYPLLVIAMIQTRSPQRRVPG